MSYKYKWFTLTSKKESKKANKLRRKGWKPVLVGTTRLCLEKQKRA